MPHHHTTTLPGVQAPIDALLAPHPHPA